MSFDTRDAEKYEEKLVKFHFMVIPLLLLSAVLSGCNTTRGIGQDLESAGEKIEELAEDAEDEIDDEGN